MKGLIGLRLAALSLGVLLTASCSSLFASGGSVPEGGTPGDTACFYPINSDQRKKLEEIVKQPGGVPAVPTPGAPGAPLTVCVLEEGDDGYQEHYYTKESAQQSNFKDFGLYALMVPHSASLLGHSLVPGPVKTLESVILGSIVCVTSKGAVYQPFSQNDDGSWTRKGRSTSMMVVKVAYGTGLVEDRQAAYAKPVPDGYKRLTLPGDNKGVLQRGPSSAAIPPAMIAPSAAAPSSAAEEEDSSPRRPNTPPTAAKVCTAPKPYGTHPNCREKP